MDNQLRQIVSYVSKEDFQTFHEALNHNGEKSTVTFAGTMLMAGIKQEVDKHKKDLDELPPEYQLEIMAFGNRIQISRQTTLNILASRNLSEEDADRLQIIAEKLGLDEEQAKNYARNNPFASVVAHANANTKMGKCLEWLSSIFSTRTEVPRASIVILAERDGYTIEMTKQAKKKLGIGHEKRKGNIWYWIAPQMEVSQQQQQQQQQYYIEPESTL